MTPKPEDVLKLAEDIVAAKKMLSDLQTQWAAIFKGSADSVAVTVRTKRTDSFASQVEAVILGKPGKLLTIAEVATALGTDDTLKVGRTLFRLSNTKRIANPERGKYSTKTRLEVAA